MLAADVFYQRQPGGPLKRYRRGDTVTGLSAGDVERLVKAGAIVSASQPEAAPAERPESAEASAERPKQVAPKAEWVEFAVSQGAVRDEAEALTKAELIEMFS